MKNLKFIIISIVILALLIGAYFLVTSLNKEEPVEEPEAEEIVVMDDTNDGIITVAYTTALGDMNFTKSTGTWTYPSDLTMPVDQEFVQKIADAFAKIVATREIVGGDESAYGFDEPTLKANICTRTGHTRVYTVGAKNEMSGGYYFKYNDKVYMIDSTLVDAVSYSLFDAVQSGDLEEIEADSITSLTVNGEEVPNKAGYCNIGITTVENYKNKEGYGFDGSEKKVVVTYTVDSPLTDESGNTTTSVSTERTYSFSYVEKDGMAYVMLPDDVCIYNATGTEALYYETETETTEA
ncbi:MAG: DUF4340 domain-containing protein [Clostridia bacterium]|nr:DUF4340 domain-containing protein [Clostridia bacterium]